MKTVYIAGRLNDDACGYLRNVSKMIKKAIEIQERGYAVFVPCLDLLMGIVAGDFEYKDYMENNIQWLEKADYLFVLADSKESKGTQKEIARAEELGIPIFVDLEEMDVYETPPAYQIVEDSIHMTILKDFAKKAIEGRI